MSFNPEAKSHAQMRYDANNTQMIRCKLNNKTDADILAYLETKDNVAGTIKEALRVLMAQDGFTYTAAE